MSRILRIFVFKEHSIAEEGLHWEHGLYGITHTQLRLPPSSIGTLRSYYTATPKTTSIKKINLYFTYESRDTLRSFPLFVTVKAVAKLNLGHRNKFEIEFQKVSRHISRSSDNAVLVILRCFFCRGRQRNVQRVITHVYSHCLLINSYCTLAEFFVGRQKIFTCRLVYGEFRQVCDKIGACRAISDSARSQNVLSGLVG